MAVGKVLTQSSGGSHHSVVAITNRHTPTTPSHTNTTPTYTTIITKSNLATTTTTITITIRPRLCRRDDGADAMTVNVAAVVVVVMVSVVAVVGSQDTMTMLPLTSRLLLL